MQKSTDELVRMPLEAVVSSDISEAVLNDGDDWISTDTEKWNALKSSVRHQRMFWCRSMAF
jgi:hypothetical protein